jgi:toxin ParE1/3/4
LGRRRVVRSPAADEDLIRIWGHIADESKVAADRVYDRIVERIFDLADFPDMGPGRSEIAVDLRSLTVMNYIILYRVEMDRVVIVRVVHGARDLSSLM